MGTGEVDVSVGMVVSSVEVMVAAVVGHVLGFHWPRSTKRAMARKPQKPKDFEVYNR